MRLVALLPALALAAGCGAAPAVSVEGVGAPAPSPTASFDPATLGEPGTWYMTRDGFEEVVGPDRDGMCAWVDRQLAKPEVDGFPPLHAAVNEIRTDAGAKRSDGLPMVVGDVCGHGERPEDRSPLPAGTSSAWGEYRFDCSRYAAHWRGQEWERSNPTAECMGGRFGPTVPPEEWASPEAVEKYRPEVYAEAFPEGSSTPSPAGE